MPQRCFFFLISHLCIFDTNQILLSFIYYFISLLSFWDLPTSLVSLLLPSSKWSKVIDKPSPFRILASFVCFRRYFFMWLDHWPWTWSPFSHDLPLATCLPILALTVLNLPTRQQGCGSLCLAPSCDLSNMEDPTSSHAIITTALGIFGAHKPHHHHKMEILQRRHRSIY